ncbi:MBL fold metallo-hydrolase [Sphingomonas sp.]|uniref:MBL fold metallo-hydrolase n=1 Tax=Sphingomonas sp. TaxID=28214 RepID=UPI001B24B25C|nr:MBL fold metallo-hydrolase [Sphingomonas sp.]MBO9712009.1 MBL fold metallo-hydrolase [Sphingomonas sp.]
MIRRWLVRILVALAVLVLAGGGYAAWRFGHPAMPADTQVLKPGTAAPGALTVQYFGATTLVFSDGRNAVMVDALLTRPDMRTVMFGKVASDPGKVDLALRRAALSRIDLLLVTHTHYDHVLDAAAVAQRTGATIVGSPSTRQVALGGNIPAARIVTVHGGERLSAGDFRVTVIRSLHSAGDRVPGDVTAPLRQPASAKDYKEGGTFAYLIEHKGFRILVHASANVVSGMYREHGVHADVVFLSTGGLTLQPPAFTQTYWRETVAATGAKLVVPIHWDDFLLPLDQPLVPLRRFLDDIPLTMSRIAPLAARDHVAVRYMPVFGPVDLVAAARTGR